MKQLVESFKELAEFQAEVIDTDCIFFVTDTDKYTFIYNKNFILKGAEVGDRMPEGSFLRRCISEGIRVEETFEEAMNGNLIKAFVEPIIEHGQIIGCYGVMINRVHSVIKAFDDLAEPLAEAFPEGAFLLITDLEKVIGHHGSKKFDIPAISVGIPIGKGTTTEKCIQKNMQVTMDASAKLFGMPTRIMSIPLREPDNQKLIGTFNLLLPRVLAENLHDLAAKLSANIQEIASQMEQVAASASEISINGIQLLDRTNEVSRISLEINQILDFIKNVADQTKILGINASIEAARAGDHGRGFKVVAEEIRKLSDHSKGNADRIRILTKEIGNKISVMCEASEGTLRQGQEQAASTQEVSAFVMEMSQMAEKLDEVAQNI